jgi:L-ascorbate 6-phosphate lactonase
LHQREDIPQAIELTKAVNPRYVIPNHYDVMALNSENPESFRFFAESAGLKAECVVMKVMEKYTVN